MEPLAFRHAPLLAAAVCFACGDALTPLTHSAPRPTALLCFGVAFLLSLTLLALRRGQRAAVPAVLCVWIGVGLWSAQIEPSPPPQTALLAYADGLSRTVEARVVRVRTLPMRAVKDDSSTSADGDEDSEQWDEPGVPATSVDLDVSTIEDVGPDASRMTLITGGVRATLFAGDMRMPQPVLRCGDLVQMPLRLRVPERYRDPGVWQYADYLLEQGVAATADAPTAKLRILPGPSASLFTPVHCRMLAAQSWAADRLLEFVRSTVNRRFPAPLRLTPEDAAMLNAMLFGDRSRLTKTLRAGFEHTGSFHLFVVSGMHVALLAGLLFWLLRRLQLSEWMATVVTLVLVFAYALLTGFGVPIERALLMTAVFLVARLLSRERRSLNAVGAAALAGLVVSPRALFEASFQMTFLAVVAIAGIAVPLGERSFLPYARAAWHLRDRWRDTALPPRLAQFRVMLRMWGEEVGGAFGRRTAIMPAALLRAVLFTGELVLIGVVCEAVMALSMAIYFHRATFYALPANMIIIPLVAVLAALGLTTFLASLIGAHIAVLPGVVLALLLHGIRWVIHRLAGAQGADFRIPGPTLLQALLALGVIAFCCWAVRRTRALAFAGLLALPVAAAIALWPVAPSLHRGQLEVTAIDVGQGDSLLAVAPDGSSMLIDAGGPTGAAANAENAPGAEEAAFDIGEQVVSPYLWSRQMRRLDVVVLTHAHSDHMGGMPAVLRNFRPRELWVAIDPDSASYRALLSEAQTLGIRVRHLRAGDRMQWGGVDVSVLAPAARYTNPGPPVNDDSLVMRMQFGKSAALLEGDAEASSESAMTAAALSGAGPVIGPDTLLKVGHHGSRTSSTPAFLALVAPQDAVISVGRNNTFGHPRPEVVSRVATTARMYRTDQYGLTSFLLSADGQISVLPPAAIP